MKSLKELNPKPGQVFADEDGDHFTVITLDDSGISRVWHTGANPYLYIIPWSHLEGQLFNKVDKSYPTVASFIRDRHNRLLDVHHAVRETVFALMDETDSTRKIAVANRSWKVDLFPMSSPSDWSHMEESWVTAYVSSLEAMGFNVEYTENGVTLSW